MANERSSNSRYITATGVTDSGTTRIAGVVVVASSANAIVKFADEAGTTTKLELRVPTSGDTKHFDFTLQPIHFPNGVKVTTLTNAIVTVIYNT